MTISELADLVGVAPSAVRFYERRGVVPAAQRGPNGYRRYDEADLARLRLVVTLRRLGISPERAGRVVAAVHDGRAEAALDDLIPFVTGQRDSIKRQMADLRLLDATLVDLEAIARSAARQRRSVTKRSAVAPHATSVLFVCTGNSARSQIAEAMLKKLGGQRFTVASAGTRPRAVHPMTIRVLSEAGVDWSEASSKSVDTLVGRRFDYVVTVCDRARRSCPTFPGEPRSVHWGLGDPASARGTFHERLEAFRRTRTEIVTRLEVFIQLA